MALSEADWILQIAVHTHSGVLSWPQVSGLTAHASGTCEQSASGTSLFLPKTIKNMLLSMKNDAPRFLLQPSHLRILVFPKF